MNLGKDSPRRIPTAQGNQKFGDVGSTPTPSISMKRIFVVECPHFGIYATGPDEKTAKTLANGCCKEAKVVAYVREK